MDHTGNLEHHSGMPREGDLGEPVQAATLAALEARIAQLAEPADLLALAAEIDQLGMQLAYEITRFAAQPELAAPLKPVLVRVPTVHTRTLLRAAERFDDLGSPKRATYVLIEALRKAFSSETIAAVAQALTFTLEAHGQAVAAAHVRALVTSRVDEAASRRELRARFLAGIDELPGLIDWNALDDEPGLD